MGTINLNLQTKRAAAWGGNAVKAPLRFLVKNHKAVQFVGYEVPNFVLMGRNLYAGVKMNPYEYLSAPAMLVGSAMIWSIAMKHPRVRENPYMLFYGGLSLAIGGMLFCGTGAVATGTAVAVASLETARGGARWAMKKRHAEIQSGEPLPQSRRYRYSVTLAGLYLKTYGALIDRTVAKTGNAGKFLDDRPLLTGGFMKLPFRAQYGLMSLQRRDYVASVVTIAWAIADIALALCDDKARTAVLERLKPSPPM